MEIRAAQPEDFADILALNQESVSVLAPMSRERLEELHARASYHHVAIDDGEVVGFLLAFGHEVDHDSVNFHWFAERCSDFIYVDRVSVSSRHRRAGIGHLLYDDFLGFARNAGYAWATCEIDAEPPNVASEEFHGRLGFVYVGTQRVQYEGGHPKNVSMRALRLAADNL